MKLTESLGWGVPFVWIGIWTAISVPWIRRDMHQETVTWEEDCGIDPEKKEERKQHSTDSEQDTPPKVPEPAV